MKHLACAKHVGPLTLADQNAIAGTTGLTNCSKAMRGHFALAKPASTGSPFFLGTRRSRWNAKSTR